MMYNNQMTSSHYNEKGKIVQTIGHIIVKDKMIKVLIRPNLHGNYISMKLRTSGKDGVWLEGESEYLEKNPEALEKLMEGSVIEL